MWMLLMLHVLSIFLEQETTLGWCQSYLHITLWHCVKCCVVSVNAGASMLTLLGTVCALK
jgi:hypothetical protein